MKYVFGSVVVGVLILLVAQIPPNNSPGSMFDYFCAGWCFACAYCAYQVTNKNDKRS